MRCGGDVEMEIVSEVVEKKKGCGLENFESILGNLN